ncbi:MAG: hypothetical protein IPK99_10325 [Flavobacteriales bacterium]|nr:hypothetical protein [Flavobacteriales bacterium]
MPLSSLKAGNTKGVDASVQFTEAPYTAQLALNGLVAGSNTQVQFTVFLDPAYFTCALSADKTQIIITTSGQNTNPKNMVYTVDTGITMKTASGGAKALVIQMVPAGQSTGTTYMFTKSTGPVDLAGKYSSTTGS